MCLTGYICDSPPSSFLSKNYKNEQLGVDLKGSRREKPAYVSLASLGNKYFSIKCKLIL